MKTIADLSLGEYACCLYDSDDQRREVLVPFVREGIARREKVTLVLDPAAVEELLKALRDGGTDPSAWVEQGRLRIAAPEDAYRKEGSFDPDRILSFHEEEARRSLEEGFGGLRVAGDIAYAMRGTAGEDRLLEREVCAGKLARGGRFLGVCLFDRRRLAPATLLSILKAYPVVGIGAELYRNPYFIPPEQIPGRDAGRESLELHLQNLRLHQRSVEAEEALRESHRRYQGLVETVSDWVWEVDGNAVYTYASPRVRDILGYDPGEILGKTPFDLMPPAEAQRVKQALGPLFARQEPFSALENVNLHKDGRPVVLETSGTPFFDENGTFLGYRGVDRDITARKRVEEELRHSGERLRQIQKFEALGRLTGGLAHHLNNMMTVVTGYSDLLLTRTDPDDPRRRDIEKIRDAGEKAAELTREMLAFGRRQVMKPKVVDANAFLSRLTATLQDLAGGSVQVSFSAGEGVGEIRLDPDLFRQSLGHLVSNARDAMPGGGEILLSTAPVFLRGTLEGIETVPGPYVLLTVRDTGGGMDAQTRANVFEPFYTTKTGSDGMGLPTVYGFVKQSGGYIFVDSALGRGTTFRLYLPGVGERGAEIHAAGALPSRGRVLVMTDEAMVRVLLVEILERGGFEVLVAGNDEEVRAALEADPSSVDLLVADLDMTGGKAADLVRRVASRFPRVVLLSAYAEEDLLGKELPLPGHVLIRKPFQTGDLLAQVERLLAGPPEAR